MSDEENPKVARRVLQIVGLVALFFASFLLFLFLTFPYEVLKEYIAANVSEATGLNLRIGAMSANFPLGITAEKIRVEPATGGPAFSLDSLSVDIGVFGFLMGNVATDIEMTLGPGDIEIDLTFGIFDLIGQNVVPKRFIMKAKDFPLDDAVAFGINAATSSPDANAMVAPLLAAIGLSAQLNGAADFKLDGKNPTESTGQAEILFKNAVLKLDHPTLGLPNQVFQQSQFKAKVENGNVVVDKSSGFVSEELELLADGKVTLKPDALESLLDLTVVVRFNKGLKERFGFVIDAVTGNSSSDGQLTMQVRGKMLAPVATPVRI